MRILFMIVAHGRAVDTVMQLLAALYRPHHHYLVHVDTQFVPSPAIHCHTIPKLCNSAFVCTCICASIRD